MIEIFLIILSITQLNATATDSPTNAPSKSPTIGSDKDVIYSIKLSLCGITTSFGIHNQDKLLDAFRNSNPYCENSNSANVICQITSITMHICPSNPTIDSNDHNGIIMILDMTVINSEYQTLVGNQDKDDMKNNYENELANTFPNTNIEVQDLIITLIATPKQDNGDNTDWSIVLLIALPAGALTLGIFTYLICVCYNRIFNNDMEDKYANFKDEQIMTMLSNSKLNNDAFMEEMHIRHTESLLVSELHEMGTKSIEQILKKEEEKIEEAQQQQLKQRKSETERKRSGSLPVKIDVEKNHLKIIRTPSV